MRNKTETRIYIAAFAVIGLFSLMLCSYCEGHTDEQVRENHERYAIIDAAVEQRDYWKDKYDSLADESDAVTVISAEAHFQQEARDAGE